MARILNGKEVRDAIAASLKEEIARSADKPALAILQIGDRADSTAYIRQKRLFAESIGARVLLKQFSESVTEAEVFEAIKTLNADPAAHGILLQLPIPDHLPRLALIEAIDPRKDVDGLTATNTKKLYDNDPSGFVPATARGILTLLEHYHIGVEGKRATVVGRSAIVGKPTAIALLNKNATVTIAHRRTRYLPKVCREADILIVAIGQPEFITADYISEGQTVIDVGINATEDGTGKKKMVGDVRFGDAELRAAFISPVPGGVGPMTVASLFQNLLHAFKQQL